MSGESTQSTWAERLRAVTYRDVDEDFIRFHDGAIDDDVSSIVNSVIGSDDTQRDGFRRSLDPESVETLRIYAKRRVLQSRRRSSMNPAEDAMDAFALLAANDVPWGTWVKAGLFIARSLGCDIDAIGQHFGEVSTVESAEHFDVAFEAMSRVESLDQCFIAEVTTTYGTGFIETIVHRDTTATGSFFSAPRQADDVVTFAPTTNLAQLAASLADAFDATGDLHTGAIAQDQLAGMSFSQQVSGAFLDTNGCLSFYADAPDGATSFKVFVAELPEETDVASLASGAEGDDQAVCFDERRLILFLAPPNFDDDDDTAFDFGDKVTIARATLQASTPVGWHNR